MDAVTLQGLSYVAILHNTGVDIVSVSHAGQQLLQTLATPLATRVTFCQRTGLLAVLEESVLRVFSYVSPGESYEVSLLCGGPVWRQWKVIVIPMRCLSGGALKANSFSHPIYTLLVNGMMTLINVETAQFQNVNDAVDIANTLTGGVVSHRAGFTANVELAADKATLLLRVGDISDVFDPLEVAMSAPLSLTTVVPIGVGSIDAKLSWRPNLSSDYEMLLVCCPTSGLCKVYMITHGKEHEEVTAALNAAVSAGLRAERGPSLCATAAPEVLLVADLTRIYSSHAGSLSSPSDVALPHMAWGHTSVLTTASETQAFREKLQQTNAALSRPAGSHNALHSSDLWLSLTRPHFEPATFTCQVLCLHPKGRYHQYEAALFGDGFAFKIDLRQQAQLLNSFFCCQFIDAWPERPVSLTLVSQFREQQEENLSTDTSSSSSSRDVLTLGLTIAASDAGLCVENSFSLLHHCYRPFQPANLQGSFVPVNSAITSNPVVRGSPQVYSLVSEENKGDAAGVLGAIASYAAQLRLTTVGQESGSKSSLRSLSLQRAPLAYSSAGSSSAVPFSSSATSALPPAPDGDCSVLRALVVTEGELFGSSLSKDSATSLLVILAGTREGAEILIYRQEQSDTDLEQAHVRASPSPSPTAAAAAKARSPSTDSAPPSLSTSRASYSVSITPDRTNGLGIRLAARENAVIIDSFKRNADDVPLAAELSGLEVGDELLSVQDTSLEGLSLAEVIEIVRAIVLNSIGVPLKITLRQPEGEDDDDNADRNSFGDSASAATQQASRTQAMAALSLRAPSPGITGRLSGSGGSSGPHETAKLIFNGARGWQRVGRLALADTMTADLFKARGQLLLANVQDEEVVFSRVVYNRNESPDESSISLVKLSRTALPVSIPSAGLMGAKLQLWPGDLDGIDGDFHATLLLPPVEARERNGKSDIKYVKACICVVSLVLIRLRSPSHDASLSWTASCDSVAQLVGEIDPLHKTQSWALLSSPLSNAELVMRPLNSISNQDSECRLEALYTARIERDQYSLESKSKDDTTCDSVLVAGTLSPLAIIRTSPFARQYAASPSSSSSLSSSLWGSEALDGTGDKSLYLSHIEGVRWVSECVFKVIGASGSVTFKRQSVSLGWLADAASNSSKKGVLVRLPEAAEDCVWRPVLQESRGGGVSCAAGVSIYGSHVCASDLQSGALSANASTPCDPVVLLTRLFGCFGQAITSSANNHPLGTTASTKNGGVQTGVASLSLSLYCLDDFLATIFSPINPASPESLQRLSQGLYSLLLPSSASAQAASPAASGSGRSKLSGKGTSSAQQSVPVPALLRSLGLHKTLLLAVVVEALRRAWAASLEITSTPPGSLISRDLERAFLAHGLDSWSQAACLLSQLHCALDYVCEKVERHDEEQGREVRETLRLLERRELGGDDADDENSAFTEPAVDTATLKTEPHMSPVVAALAFFSSAQAPLMQAFLLDPMESHFKREEERNMNIGGGGARDDTNRESLSLTGRRLPLRPKAAAGAESSANAFSMTNSPSSSAIEFDALALANSSLAALWMHDPSPLADFIGTAAMREFRHHKDSMKIFLELVLADKVDRLTQLARVDRSGSGQQLLTLLGQDLRSERGRQVLKKNAFALMRLKRHKHAAATFLLSDPPMVKEACGVLAQQMADPLLALLVGRIVEHRLAVAAASGLPSSALPAPAGVGVGAGVSAAVSAPFAHRSGFVLGPVSRGLLKTYVVPDLLAITSGQPCGIRYPLAPGLDKRVALVLASLWVQEADGVVRSVTACVGGGMFRGSSGEGGMDEAGEGSSGRPLSHASSSRQAAVKSVLTSLSASRARIYALLSTFPAFVWCTSLRPALLPAGCLGGLHAAIDGVLREQGPGCAEVQLQAYRAFLVLRKREAGAGEGARDSAFDRACRGALMNWRAVQAARLAVRAKGESAAAEESFSFERPSAFGSFEIGLSSASSAVMQGVGGTSQAPAPAPAAAAAAGGLTAEDDVDEDVRRAQERLLKTQQRERLQRLQEEKEAAATATATDVGAASAEPVRKGGGFNLAYEPVRSSRPSAEQGPAPAQARSIFDAFDVAPRNPRPQPAAPKNMLDMFDSAPPPRPRPTPVQPPRNMLDMYDVPPPARPRPKEPDATTPITPPPLPTQTAVEQDDDDDNL